jgi:7-carboxy-7-deazaguanine synthase
MIKVNEHFLSIQGEGPYAGTPSYFIRLSGCILRCLFCDSKFSWNKDIGQPLDDFDIDIPENCEHIVISGGEPLLHMYNPEFISFISRYRKKVSIETTAIHTLKTFPTSIFDCWNALHNRLPKGVEFPTLIVSPKLGRDSYPIDVNTYDIIEHYKLMDDFQADVKNSIFYKLVFEESKRDILKIFIMQIPKWFLENVYIMPMTPIPFVYDRYIKNCKNTIEFCKEMGLRYTPRIHIDVYGVRQGV